MTLRCKLGLSNDYLQFYEALRANTHPEGFLAMQLCDAFLTDILRRPGSPTVYSITSAVAADCLRNPVLDGFLYPSTKLDGHPNLALRPSVVDDRVRYETAMAVRVERDLGYGIFATKVLSQGTVRGDTIDWD
jgi:chloramphenicol 3-O-phosphotransferase